MRPILTKSYCIANTTKNIGKIKSDFLRPDNVEFSKIGKFPSVGILIVVSFFWFAQSKKYPKRGRK